MLATQETAPRTTATADGARVAVRFDGIEKSFAAADAKPMLALANISLSVAEGEFLSVVGPSGCGKSTLLQIAAGLMPASQGQVLIDGGVVRGPPDRVVYLFQQYSRSLLPWRSALDNVAFAIEHRLPNRVTARQQAMSYLRMVGLEGFGGHFPRQLSGGMQQRVVIARALAAQPQILLLDEPFSSVDALTRMELHALVLQLQQTYRFTAILVTHDVEEAVFLADRVAVLAGRPGRLVGDIAVDLPRPRDAFTTRESERFIALRHHLLRTVLQRAA
jgi:NitT/TauT family transport system ATP-binding protein